MVDTRVFRVFHNFLIDAASWQEVLQGNRVGETAVKCQIVRKTVVASVGTCTRVGHFFVCILCVVTINHRSILIVVVGCAFRLVILIFWNGDFLAAFQPDEATTE